MDTKSKILFAIFGILIVGSVVVSYYKFMVVRDYIIEAEADCDPYTEACFVYVCDPEVDGEDCTGDLEEDTWYYKYIHRNAKNIPLCDPNDENCDALTCPEGEAECEFILCDEKTVGEGETCNDPVAYTLEHPEEEEEDGEGMEDEGEGAEEADTGEADTEEGNGENSGNNSASEETTTPEVTP